MTGGDDRPECPLCGAVCAYPGAWSKRIVTLWPDVSDAERAKRVLVRLGINYDAPVNHHRVDWVAEEIALARKNDADEIDRLRTELAELRGEWHGPERRKMQRRVHDYGNTDFRNPRPRTLAEMQGVRLGTDRRRDGK